MAFDKPQSRNEAILQNMLGANNELEPPQSRMEALLQEIAGQMPEANPSEGTTTGTLDRLKIGDEIYSVEGGGGIRPIGVTTTPLYDGATTNPIQINGESYTAETGDMVTYQSTEFLFNVNEVWQELGDVSVVLAIIDDIFADIAPAFDATRTYAVGDYVIYNDQLYKCTTDHTGTWASADFTATSLSDEIKNKQNTLTAGSHIEIDDDTISVNRWAVPAGKVVYTVITSDENYGQNVHVQRHTTGGGFIDDRTFLCEMYKTVNIDGLISIYNPYASFNITLLENSDEHQSGYSYTVNPITTPTSNSFTFTLAQEENDNDLIIRSELTTALATKADLTDLAPAFSASTAYTVGQYVSYDGNIYKCTSAHSAGAWVAGDFTLVAVGSALESKQDKTDNSLQTTSKTVVGAVNELKSGLTSLLNAFSSLGLSAVNGKVCQTYKTN